jgi:hypothetical protein
MLGEEGKPARLASSGRENCVAVGRKDVLVHRSAPRWAAIPIDRCGTIARAIASGGRGLDGAPSKAAPGLFYVGSLLLLLALLLLLLLLQLLLLGELLTAARPRRLAGASWDAVDWQERKPAPLWQLLKGRPGRASTCAWLAVLLETSEPGGMRVGACLNRNLACNPRKGSAPASSPQLRRSPL